MAVSHIQWLKKEHHNDSRLFSFHQVRTFVNAKRKYAHARAQIYVFHLVCNVYLVCIYDGDGLQSARLVLEFFFSNKHKTERNSWNGTGRWVFCCMSGRRLVSRTFHKRILLFVRVECESAAISTARRPMLMMMMMMTALSAMTTLSIDDNHCG